MEHVVPYAFVIFLGSVPMSFKLFFEYLVRTDGRSYIGMIMSLTGLAFNIVFDYILWLYSDWERLELHGEHFFPLQ